MFKPSHLISKVTIYLISFWTILVLSGCSDVEWEEMLCNSEYAVTACAEYTQHHFDNSDTNRFDNTAYTADYSNTTNLQGVWVVITSNGDARERYNCQLTLQESTTDQYTSDCDLFAEFPNPLTYTSATGKVATERTVMHEGNDVGDGEIYGTVYQYNVYVDANLMDAGHITGSIYRDEYASDGRALTPKTITFEMVRIDDQYQVLGNIKLRNFVGAFNDAEAPYTETYPITRFYEYSAKPAVKSTPWIFRFYDDNNRVLYASAYNTYYTDASDSFYNGPSGTFEMSLGADAIAKQYVIYNNSGATMKNSRYEYIKSSYYYGRFDRLINNTEQMQINFDYIQTGSTDFAETKIGVIELSF